MQMADFWDVSRADKRVIVVRRWWIVYLIADSNLGEVGKLFFVYSKLCMRFHINILPSTILWTPPPPPPHQLPSLFFAVFLLPPLWSFSFFFFFRVFVGTIWKWVGEERAIVLEQLNDLMNVIKLRLDQETLMSTGPRRNAVFTLGVVDRVWLWERGSGLESDP